MAALLCAAAPLTAQTPPPVSVIRAARMIDVRSGAVIRNAMIVVEGGRIRSAGPATTPPANAQVIDLGDATMLPGLIDAHTHLLQNYEGRLGGDDPNMLLTVATMSPARRALLGAKMAREDLEAGITTVRDVGNSGRNGDVALRDAIDAGWVEGPRMIVSTRALSSAGGQFGELQPAAQSLVDEEYAVVTTPDDARRAVQQAFYDGADVIKVIVNTGPRIVSLATMRAIVDEAHRAGKRVAAHAIGDTATLIAAEAGVNSIEHAYIVPDTVLRIMARKGIYLVATDYPASFYVDVFGGTMTDAGRARALAGAQRIATGNADRLRRARAMGVKIAFGSDEYYDAPGMTRGEASLLPLQAYQEAGMPPIDILRAATINAADLLGLGDRIGTLEPGKLADVIAVDGNPLDDMKLLRKVRFVMKAGRIIEH